VKVNHCESQSRKDKSSKQQKIQNNKNKKRKQKEEKWMGLASHPFLERKKKFFF